MTLRFLYNLLTFKIAKADAELVKNVVVQIGSAPAVVFPKPGASPKPKLAGKSPVAITGSASSVDFNGENLDQITNVLFGTTSLGFFSEMNGTVLHVFLNKDVTAKSGSPTSLALKTLDGTTLIGTVNIQDTKP